MPGTLALDGAAAVTLSGNVLAVPPGAVHSGQRVTVEYVEREAGTLPLFRPSAHDLFEEASPE